MPVVFYAFAGYFVLALVLTFPLVTSIGKAVSDPVDPILNTWILAWEHHAILTQPLELLNANIFYPYTQTLLYSETLLVPSLLLLPIKVATGNAILTHNLLVLAGFAMTGASGYLLGRWLFRSHWSGLVLGGVLAFNSYTLSNIGQAQLLHLEWLPLALLYLGKLLQRPQLRFAWLIALFLAAQFYTVVYYGFFGFVVVGLVGGFAWLLKAYPSMRMRLQTMALFAGSLLVALLLCLPLAIPYYRLSDAYGFERTLADAWPFSASLQMWMTAPTDNFVYGGLLGGELPKLGFYPIDALFPGGVLLFVAVCGLLVWFWQAIPRQNLRKAGWRSGELRWQLLLLLGVAFFFVLSLGPYVQVESLQPNFSQLLPYAWMHQWVPGFQALRAPGRFASMVFLGLALAVGYFFMQLRWRVVQFVMLVLLCIEVLLVPSNALFTPTIDVDQLEAYEWLATQPRTAYLELPVYSFGQEGEEARWLESQFQSIRHWHSTPVGYSGFFPPHYDDLLRFVSEFPKAEVVYFLQAMGVEWVVVHRGRLTEEQWRAIEADVAANGWETQRWGAVWAIHLLPREAPRPDQRYFIPDVAQAGGMMALGAILTSEQPAPVIAGSKLGVVRAQWWQGEQRVLVAEKSMQPPFFVNPVAVSTVTIPVPEAAGLYSLQIYGDDGGKVLASANVNVVEDVAPPESRLLPLAGLEAAIVCEEGEAQIEILMQTIGWYEEPFTLSARVVDGGGAEVARSAADVEFAVERPRSNLLYRQQYRLPLDEVPSPEIGPLAVDLIAYRWQQEAERVVTRHFVGGDGAVVGTLRLPLERC